MKKFFLTGLKVFVIICVSGVLGWIVFNAVYTYSAENKAHDILIAVDAPSEDERIISLTRYVFEGFTEVKPNQDKMLRLRGYLTNRRLPKILQLESGVIETHVNKGMCDNAARRLAFILSREGYNSAQWNMIKHSGGHSALLVTLKDEREVLVDPFYGVVALGSDGKLISPVQAQKLIQDGASTDKIFFKLNNDSNTEFYKNFNTTMMSAEGDNLIIEATLPKLNNSPIVWGQIDNNFKDVMSATNKKKITPYWHYMGHKYNREWMRVLKAQEPVNVTFTLFENVHQNVITSNIMPEIDGKSLTWRLKAGDQLEFHDGDAKIILSRMNSYIHVDQITLSPVD